MPANYRVQYNDAYCSILRDFLLTYAWNALQAMACSIVTYMEDTDVYTSWNVPLGVFEGYTEDDPVKRYWNINEDERHIWERIQIVLRATTTLYDALFRERMFRFYFLEYHAFTIIYKSRVLTCFAVFTIIKYLLVILLINSFN